MKKAIKISICALLVLILSVSALSSLCFAASPVIIGLSAKTLKVGDGLTVTVTINPGTEMYGTEADIVFDSSVLRFNSGTSANLINGKVHIVGTPGGAKSQAYTISFTALAETADTKISATDVAYVGDSKVSLTGATVKVAITNPTTSSTPETTLSNDANLKSLKVSGGTLSPAFKATTTSYSVYVKNDVTKVSISATAANGAKITGTGNVSLSVGDNKRSVSVVAQDGKAKKTYYINIRRLAEDETEPTEQPTENPDVDPLAVTVGSTACHVLATVSDIAVPNGFVQNKSVYNGTEIETLVDSGDHYTLFVLRNDKDNSTDYYTYNEMRDEFKLLPYMNNGGKTYIFVDPAENRVAPDGYYASTANLGNGTVRVYCSEDERLADFFMIECCTDGKIGFYSYDTVENTFQRAPAFNTVFAKEAPVVEKKESNNKLLQKFSRISGKGKLIVILILVAILCLIGFAVFLILFLVNRQKEVKIGFLPEDEGFDFSEESEPDGDFPQEDEPAYKE